MVARHPKLLNLVADIHRTYSCTPIIVFYVTQLKDHLEIQDG